MGVGLQCLNALLRALTGYINVPSKLARTLFRRVGWLALNVRASNEHCPKCKDTV